MNLSHAFLALAASISKASIVAGQVYYPDWTGATGTCLSDGNESIDMINGGNTRTTIESCCADYYGWTVADECRCLDLGGGTACTGTNKWYADYQNGKCQQDCPEDGATCGGLAEAVDTLYADAAACCAAKMPSIAAGKCAADSAGTVYMGSLKYYVNYQGANCVQDCEGAAPCGGIIVDNTKLFADAAACCADKLSYVDADICAALSDPASTGTNKFFADSENKMCLLDNDSCPPGNTCARADALSGALYDDAAACCTGGLAWVDSAFCESLTTGTPSGKWFVDYDNQVCKSDCDTGDSWCVDITTLESLPTTLYDTSLACCDAKLSWVAGCDDLSKGNVPTGSGKWYVDYESSSCVTDCDVSGGGTCGGLATNQELFADAATCCSTKLSYVATGLCQANSAGTTYTGSLKYYVDYENTNCVQDCDGAAPCGGIVTDTSTALFADVAACCAEKLSYVDADLCAALSDPTSTGTDKYFPDVQTSMCIRDNGSCPAGYTCARATATSGTLYDDEASCCAEGLSWMDTDLCVAMTQGVPSGKWFADYTNLVCANDCDDGSPYCADITTLDQMPSTLYDTALECCDDKIGWTDAATCDAVSQIGAANYAGSNKWYAAQGNICVQDCDVSGGASCGGILALGSSKPRYETAAACCAGQYSWYDSGLCAAMSTATFTNKFYVGGTNKCAQDCAVAGGGACAGHPSDVSVKLFDTAAACCAEKFSYLTSDECVSATTGAAPTGSTKFYVDWSVTKCVQDCVGAAPCGGIMKSWNTAFATSAACCKSLSWVRPSDCVLA